MMKSALAIFVKTPLLSPVKTRLAKDFGEQRAIDFYKLSVKAVESVVRLSLVHPFWAFAEEKGVSHWTSFDSMYQGPGGLGDRLHFVYSKLIKNFDSVILIGADAPQITLSMIDGAIKILERENDFVLGPAGDGGFYLFGGRLQIEKRIWLEVPYSVESTSKRLETLLSKLGSIGHLEALDDVDTMTNLKSLDHDLKHLGSEATESQKTLLNWIIKNRHGA